MANFITHLVKQRGNQLGRYGSWGSISVSLRGCRKSNSVCTATESATPPCNETLHGPQAVREYP
jgi:hypothetical protein